MKKLVITAALLMSASFIIPAMAQVGTDSSSGGLQGIFDDMTASSISSTPAVSSSTAMSSTPNYSSSSSSTEVGGFSSSSASSLTPGLPNTGEGGMAVR